MIVKKFHIILIVLVIMIFAINIYFMSQNGKQTVYIPDKQTDVVNIGKPESKQNLIKISKECVSDLDCSWQITNCCSENAGGSWQCISKESKIECNEFILCPQVVSSKPERTCSCVERKCSV